METLSIKQFIKSGKLGELGIDSSIDSVIDKLGKSYDSSFPGETQIIKYGWYEFLYFRESGKLLCIQNDHLNVSWKLRSKKVKFDPWFLELNNISLNDVAKILNDENIEFKISNFYDAKIITCLESRVEIGFMKNEDENDDYKLFKISLSSL